MSQFLKMVEQLLVFRNVRRLIARRLIPLQAVGLQLLQDLPGATWLAAGAVEIVDADQPDTAVASGLQPGRQRCRK